MEKPQQPKSNLAIVGGYLFDETIFESIRRIKPSWRNEYEITDAVQDLIDRRLAVVPYIVESWWKDIGKPEDILDANRAMLEAITHTVHGRISADSRLEGAVSIVKITGPGLESGKFEIKIPFSRPGPITPLIAELSMA